ncbi:endonuclease/exonuclease/phosphatase family protein [Plantactinospora sp. KBS50]|uniref:endonuclease/exonuclease/phosphatase family protein n=1 Tax=Plantactinospora sp. KBS50 TaxID=2024580 RepID=UPI000BAAF236|nr:endonuclease/exonuclease/phosphatase family protein [Plantactinospora sp. KBS50]ASW57870.1 endonuclease [Plantactinospora sp. KBS50]
MRVLSYNVHGQRDDRAALAATVRAAAPDVLIVQEAPRRFRWQHKCAALAEAFGMVVAVGGLPSLGNLVLTTLRVRVHRTWTQRYPLTPGRHLRGAAYAECSVGPDPDGTGTARFVVAGSHLSTDPAERPAQAALLRSAVGGVRLPVILGADLNDVPGGPAWQAVADGLTDAAVAADRADRLTFPCAGPRQRLDAVFVDPRIRVRDYDVPDTADSRRASDHLPVLADLILPPG